MGKGSPMIRTCPASRLIEFVLLSPIKSFAKISNTSQGLFSARLNIYPDVKLLGGSSSKVIREFALASAPERCPSVDVRS